MPLVRELEKLQRLLQDELLESGHFRSLKDIEFELNSKDYQSIMAELLFSTSDNYKIIMTSFGEVQVPNLEMETEVMNEKLKEYM